jgi:hypothetical protein
MHHHCTHDASTSACHARPCTDFRLSKHLRL